MRFVLAVDLQEGMILGEDIVDNNMMMILSSGTLLNAAHIRMLENRVFAGAQIVEKSDEDGAVKPLIIEDRLSGEYQKSVESFKNIFMNARIGKKIVVEEMEECVTPLIHEIENNNNIAKRLWQIENCDAYTFDHSVQVCMIATLLGKWLGYKDAELKDLAMAGMLHDIGKINIPDEILNKPDELTESEFRIMKTHPTLGYVLLMNNKAFSDNVLQAVHQHHEQYDGMGYPNGIKGKEIHRFARIVTIADVYSAMISDRLYRKRRSPFEVARIIMDSTFGSFDPYYSMIFLNKISQFYIGNIVKLTTGQIGEVVMIPRNEPTRPLIKIENGFVDLLKDFSVEIEEIIY